MKGFVKKQNKSNSWEFLDMKVPESNSKGKMKLLDSKEDDTVDKKYINSNPSSGVLCYIDNGESIRNINSPLDRINLNVTSCKNSFAVQEGLLWHQKNRHFSRYFDGKIFNHHAL
jgi:hypothetical protein